MSINPIVAKDCDKIIERLGSRLDYLAGGTIFISGAGGFLCSYIVDVLARWNEKQSGEKCWVIAADNYIANNNARLSHLEANPQISLRVQDVTKPIDIIEPINWIIHGASIASPPFYRQFPLETLDVNINGTRNLLNMARDYSVNGILVISSSEIYGNPDSEHIPTPEDYWGNVSCVGPRACYDESKRVAETLCWIYYQQYNVPVKIVRPFNVYGPGQNLDDGRIIPDMIRSSLQHKPVTLYSDGLSTRSFCYISDAIVGLLSVLIDPATSGETYNLGNDEVEITVSDLANLMCELSTNILERPSPGVKFADSSDTDYNTNSPERRRPNLEKIAAAVGYKSSVTLEAGLARTLKSYIEDRS